MEKNKEAWKRTSVSCVRNLKCASTVHSSPFLHLNFDTHQLYEITNPSKVLDSKQNKALEKMLNIPYSCDFWKVPSVFNVKKLVDNLRGEEFLNGAMVESVQVPRLFVIIEKDNCQQAISYLSHLELKTIKIPEKVAGIIKVKHQNTLIH